MKIMAGSSQRRPMATLFFLMVILSVGSQALDWTDAKTPGISLELVADPVRASSAADINFATACRIVPAPNPPGDSFLEVSDMSGVVVTKVRDPLSVSEHQKWIAFSSSGGPKILQRLAPGTYSVVWTYRGHRSNVQHFEIGSNSAPFLSLEESRGGFSGDCLMIHVFNNVADRIDTLRGLAGSRLMVDGKVYKRQGISWIGSSSLPRGWGWGAAIRAKDYGSELHGSHVVSFEFADRWSNKVKVSCD